MYHRVKRLREFRRYPLNQAGRDNDFGAIIVMAVQESEEMTKNKEEPDSTEQPPDTNRHDVPVEVSA